MVSVEGKVCRVSWQPTQPLSGLWVIPWHKYTLKTLLSVFRVLLNASTVVSVLPHLGILHPTRVSSTHCYRRLSSPKHAAAKRRGILVLLPKAKLNNHAKG